jgi:mannose-6-phosphate isomerase
MHQKGDGLPLLSFVPLLKSRVWGGRRFQSALGRALPQEGGPFGESWEIVDLAAEQSLVADGALAGTSLGELAARSGPELLGRARLLDGRFPLLLKFVDASERLSVQVHPGAAACAALSGQGARVKTECWHVMACEPGSALYVGLEPGVDRRALEEALAAGEAGRLLHRCEVARGDFVHIPAGTVHAIGGGILLAEVQQSSDTTYRLFDWNRVGLDGAPRPLQLAEALVSIDFSRIGCPEFAAPSSGRPGVSCPEFEVELIEPPELAGGCELSSEGPVALMGVRGGGTVEIDAPGAPRRYLPLGGTVLVPACRAARFSLKGDGSLTVLAAFAAPQGR